MISSVICLDLQFLAALQKNPKFQTQTVLYERLSKTFFEMPKKVPESIFKLHFVFTMVLI